jgi:NAD(P)-dependent dehydrogenase (short-subunit alcohol dehydrogenase family)
MSYFDLAGKVAIITGSSRGIGKAIAAGLAAHGAKVVISSRKQAACEVVATELNERYGNATAIAIAASISDQAALQNLVDATRRVFGKIDILVCNAASNPYYGPMSGISDEQFTKILANNVIANHWIIQMVVPEMIERRDGSVVVISSIGGLRGSSTMGAYCVSKAADFQLVRNLALELGPRNVRINSIAPGVIRTDFAKAIWEDRAAEQALDRFTPLRRIGEPDDIGGAAVFLASDASRFMTGQVLLIDGGMTINMEL